MDQLIDTIRAATASGASPDQKADGVQACRTIIAALDTKPGKPIALPGTPSPGARPSFDQVLDLAIARLTTLANERDKNPAPSLPPSNGLRVPVTPALPRAATRPTAQPKRSPGVTRKP